MGKTVIFYKTEEGKCPVQDFLDSLPGSNAEGSLGVESI